MPEYFFVLSQVEYFLMNLRPILNLKYVNNTFICKEKKFESIKFLHFSDLQYKV